MQRIALLTMTGLLLATAGCSKSAEEPVAAAPAAAPPVAPPDAAVREFLDAIRVGDHKRAEGMLTDTARQKTSEMDLLVAPPGSATAKFEIAEMEVIEDQVAHVASVWTDIGDDGKPQTNEFVWALRRQPQGWRVAGVAVQLFPNQPPLLLDFEDPADMLRKQQMAEAEAQRQINAAAQASAASQAGGVAGAATGQGNGIVPTGGTLPSDASKPTMPATGGEPALLQGAVPQPGQNQR